MTPFSTKCDTSRCSEAEIEPMLALGCLLLRRKPPINRFPQALRSPWRRHILSKPFIQSGLHVWTHRGPGKSASGRPWRP